MKKIIIFLIIIFAAYLYFSIRSAPRLGTVQAAVIAETSTQYVMSPTFIPTGTPVPTSTIGYEATIMIAQATADEARRVNAEVTAAHEANILSILQLTADGEKRNQEILSWTAQAGPTIIPLTATQQVISNTQLANGQQIVAAGYTQQAAAPTQYAAMVQGQATKQFAQINEIMKLFAMGALLLFMLALVAFFNRFPIQPKQEQELPTETVVQMRKDNGQGSFQQTRVVVPCSPDQLSELAELAVDGEKRFGINRMESSSRTFRGQRATLLAVREFLVTNGFVIADDNGHIALNANGEAFLAGWFDFHKLPIGVEFAPPPAPLT